GPALGEPARLARLPPVAFALDLARCADRDRRRPRDPVARATAAEDWKCDRGSVRSQRMKTSLACLALCATALVGAAPPSPKPMTPDAKLRFLMHYVQPSLLKETIIGLTSFGTRHTLSASASPHRGIAAALDWAEGDFKRWSAACNDCLD